jgi:AraC-like DNA-binding protein
VINATEILPGVIFYSYLSAIRKEKVGIHGHNTLVLQVSGQMAVETSLEKVTTKPGEMLLIRKNQLVQLTKMPLAGENYQTIAILLQEDFLRQIALEQQIELSKRYTGPSNILIPTNDFLRGYFQSVIPYIHHPEEELTTAVGMLKVKEGVQLLLHTMPGLKEFLFDFSDPHKIDLEKFMLANYHFNVTIEKFAQLTGRSLAAFKRDFQKQFGMPPRQWLQEKRLTEARHLIEKKNKKPSAIYLDLGFESLAHFSHSFKKKFGKTPTERA